MTNKFSTYTLAQCQHALADCHATLEAGEYQPDHPYGRKVWAEIDALRERIATLKAKPAASTFQNGDTRYTSKVATVNGTKGRIWTVRRLKAGSWVHAGCTFTPKEATEDEVIYKAGDYRI
jgi:hypothetical protein